MKDQIAALNQAGIPAAFVNSSLSGDEIRAICRGLRAGEYRLLYIAPERLESEGFSSLVRGLDLSMVAVDEAHCISQWGQDFRPSYLRIADFIATLPKRIPVAAFTATATEQVRRDIVRLLGLQSPVLVVTGFDRPNLFFEVRHPLNKGTELRDIVLARQGKSGIVYCATRSGVERVCDSLRYHGVAASRYHAGLPDDERRQNQEDFIHDRCTVMVATNAFGMGIDKSNVSYVVHYNMPKSLEDYYQEAGRAGRDGSAAECILLYAPGDVQTARFLIENSAENDALTDAEHTALRRRALLRLNTMVKYCTTSGCLRAYILGYFGQEHESSCQSCGSCVDGSELRDITREAQMALSCIKRIRDRLGYGVGAALTVQVLAGSQSKRVLELGLNELSTYGLMRGKPREWIAHCIEHLRVEGYVAASEEYGSLALTAAAGDVLFRGKKVSMRVKKEPEKEKKAAAHAGGDLFTALKALRTQIAQRERLPSYLVFSNASLESMASIAPRSIPEFLMVSGVGEKRAERYGREFIDEINRFYDEKRS